MSNLGHHRNSDWLSTGGLSEILNKPDSLSDFQNDLDLAPVAYTGAYSELLDKPELKAVATTGLYADLLSKPALKTVATTGAYADLTGKPFTFRGIAFGGLGGNPSNSYGTIVAGTMGVYNLNQGAAGNGGTTGRIPHMMGMKNFTEQWVPFVSAYVPNSWSWCITAYDVDDTYIYVNTLKFNSGSGAAQNGIFGSHYDQQNVAVAWQLYRVNAS